MQCGAWSCTPGEALPRGEMVRLRTEGSFVAWRGRDVDVDYPVKVKGGNVLRGETRMSRILVTGGEPGCLPPPAWRSTFRGHSDADARGRLPLVALAPARASILPRAQARCGKHSQNRRPPAKSREQGVNSRALCRGMSWDREGMICPAFTCGVLPSLVVSCLHLWCPVAPGRVAS
jgi:hypothetical protein